MARGLEEIRNALAKISNRESSMDMLMDFERVLNEYGILAYDNWIDGELVDGPHWTEFWFMTTWMWPGDKKPAAGAIARLQRLGGSAVINKDILKQPVRVLEPSDWQDTKTKRAKIEEKAVWIVDISIPIELIETDPVLNDDNVLNDLKKEEPDPESEEKGRNELEQPMMPMAPPPAQLPPGPMGQF